MAEMECAHSSVISKWHGLRIWIEHFSLCLHVQFYSVNLSLWTRTKITMNRIFWTVSKGTRTEMRTPRSTTETEAGSYYTYYTGVQRASSSSGPLSNAVPMQRQRWYDFDPHIDVQIGNFVAVQAPEEVQRNGEVFWVAKVREIRNAAREDGELLALWYWPTRSKKPSRWAGCHAQPLRQLPGANIGA